MSEREQQQKQRTYRKCCPMNEMSKEKNCKWACDYCVLFTSCYYECMCLCFLRVHKYHTSPQIGVAPEAMTIALNVWYAVVIRQSIMQPFPRVWWWRSEHLYTRIFRNVSGRQFSAIEQWMCALCCVMWENCFSQQLLLRYELPTPIRLTSMVKSFLHFLATANKRKKQFYYHICRFL